MILAKIIKLDHKKRMEFFERKRQLLVLLAQLCVCASNSQLLNCERCFICTPALVDSCMHCVLLAQAKPVTLAPDTNKQQQQRQSAHFCSLLYLANTTRRARGKKRRRKKEKTSRRVEAAQKNVEQQQPVAQHFGCTPIQLELAPQTQSRFLLFLSYSFQLLSARRRRRRLLQSSGFV